MVNQTNKNHKYRLPNLRTKLLAGLLFLSASLISGGLLSGSAAAATDAYFTISPPSGSSYTKGSHLVVTISETSAAADDVNAAQANFSYPTTLQFNSISVAGPFTLVGQEKGGSGMVKIGLAATSP
ncbi:MAG: hypothetical protein ACREGF_07200, partial [Candidatus Saccharimonadales bacterium]